LNCMKMLTEVVSKRDEFSVCGDHIANKLWRSGRSHQEISIALHHTEQICFNLIMDAYSPKNNFGPQNYSQYKNVPQNPPAFNYASQLLSTVWSEHSYTMTPMPSSSTSEDSVYSFS
jgi:hypothetical protein